MENQSIPVKGTILQWGVILGVVSVLIGAVRYAMNDHLNQESWMGYLSMIAFIALIVMAVKAYKGVNGGALSLGQAIKIGVGVGLIAAIIGAIWTYVMMTFLEPNMADMMLEVARETNPERFQELDNMPAEQKEQAMEMAKMFSGPGALGIMQIVFGLIGGLIISLIAGLVMKTE